MLISEAIKQLEQIQKEHGDIEICLNTDQAYRDFDGSFIPLDSFSVEDVGQHENEDENSKMKKVSIAVLEFHDAFVVDHED